MAALSCEKPLWLDSRLVMEPLQTARDGARREDPPRAACPPPRPGSTDEGRGCPLPSHTPVPDLRAVPGAVPEVLRADDLRVVHDFALVRGDLQRGQHIVHAGQVGGGAGWHAVELPLQDVESRPPCHV